ALSAVRARSAPPPSRHPSAVYGALRGASRCRRPPRRSPRSVSIPAPQAPPRPPCTNPGWARLTRDAHPKPQHFLLAPQTYAPTPCPTLSHLHQPRLDGLDGGLPPNTAAFPHSCPTCQTCPTLSGGSRNFYEYSTRPPYLYILLFTFILI